MAHARNRRAKPLSFVSFVEQIDELDDEQAATVLAALPASSRESIEHDWRNWWHGGQRTPDGDASTGSAWRTWVIKAGRGFGKTRAGAEWIKAAIRGGAALRIALVAATIEEAARIMIHGNSGLLRIAAPWIERWRPSERTLFFKGGAQATLFSGANPEGLRGPEHHLAWCDELAKWEKAQETWDNLQLGMRLGDLPQVLVTTTPRAGPVLRRIIDAKGTVTTEGPTHDNVHLPAAFIEAIEEQYAGTRLGRQEVQGELLTDAPGALWTEALLERQRLSPRPLAGEGETRSGEGEGESATAQALTLATLCAACPSPASGRGQWIKTVIGVDPPSGDGTCGIIACAKDADGQLHVLADHSVTGLTPEGWARKVSEAAAAHGARYVVAEDNQGGAMVGAVLKSADRQLNVRPVKAHTSKSDRATPVSTRFEAGKVWLHGCFPELEAELCGMIAGGGYEGPGRSPDRADAMVWVLTDLMEERALPRVRVL